MPAKVPVSTSRWGNRAEVTWSCQAGPCSDRRPGHAAFDEFRGKALPVQRGGDRETGYSSANDQDPLNVSHISSFRRCEQPECLGDLLSSVHA
jgi:hypothetical protein